MGYVKSTRNLDKISEQAIDNFLSEFFYSKNFESFSFIKDKEKQISGIDVVADELLIDNKAMSSPRYINNPADTFILELLVQSEYRGEYLGWFINPDILTTHYLFVWVHEADVNQGAYIKTSEQIQKIEVMLVDRKKLHAIINKVCDDNRLLDIAHSMITKNNRSISIKDFGYYNSPYFVYSNQLNEKPVNLVTPKAWLKEAAIKHCFVTKKEITDIA